MLVVDPRCSLNASPDESASHHTDHRTRQTTKHRQRMRKTRIANRIETNAMQTSERNVAKETNEPKESTLHLKL